MTAFFLATRLSSAGDLPDIAGGTILFLVDNTVDTN